MCYHRSFPEGSLISCALSIRIYSIVFPLHRLLVLIIYLFQLFFSTVPITCFTAVSIIFIWLNVVNERYCSNFLFYRDLSLEFPWWWFYWLYVQFKNHRLFVECEPICFSVNLSYESRCHNDEFSRCCKTSKSVFSTVYYYSFSFV